MDGDRRQRLHEWLQTIHDELDRVVSFWMKHSHDREHGGFFTCLDKDGSVFDETKYVWLQGRQVWMYARLYNETKRFKTDEILQAAVKGAQFLLKKCLVKRPDGVRCAFSTTRVGMATKIQRTIFSECFFVMAMSEMSRATNEQTYKEAAVNMMKRLQHWCMVDDSQLGREALPGNVPTSSLAVPMMALCVSKQMEECDLKWCEDKELEKWAIHDIMKHIQRDGGAILETVSADGEEIPGSVGRLQIPGHAIECGWFLLKHCKISEDKLLSEKAIRCFIDKPFKQGWDKEHGGLLYFIDVDGYPPTQLEWSMKLWWPHNEVMIAFLMAYQSTGDLQYLDKFDEVAQYTLEKFRDADHGGWFGYLDRRGVVSSRFKGGPWKGFFHVPRSLLLCENLLRDILE